MINCRVRGQNARRIRSIICTGHTSSAGERDGQLVCAAVTAVVTGAANALETLLDRQVICESRAGYIKLASVSTNERWFVSIFVVYVQLLTIKNIPPHCFVWQEHFS